LQKERTPTYYQYAGAKKDFFNKNYKRKEITLLLYHTQKRRGKNTP